MPSLLGTALGSALRGLMPVRLASRSLVDDDLELTLLSARLTGGHTQFMGGWGQTSAEPMGHTPPGGFVGLSLSLRQCLAM